VRHPGAGRPLYGIDAGGSHTSVRAWNGDSWNAPPLNPSSVGQEESDRRLSEFLGQLRAHADRSCGPVGELSRDACQTAGPVIWLASASIDRATAGKETRRWAAAASRADLHARLLLSNDVTPLLLGSPPDTGHVIAVCGTGSGFLATDGRSAPVRVGGCEYLGSDEGSAFDLGLRGLRAAVRGLDGRGQRTALSGLLAADVGMPAAEHARRLAQLPFPKSAVAALAPVVLGAWLDADPVAGELVDEAIGELMLGVRAARDAAVLQVWRLSVVGGVMTGCPEFFARLATSAAGLGADPVELIGDPAAAVLAALTQLAGADRTRLSDPRIDQDVWSLELAEPNAERAD
jgi:N-acetylglucosamine kinase-like BadF-type ATPase